jgi:hypothetical protein
MLRGRKMWRKKDEGRNAKRAKDVEKERRRKKL